MSEERKQPGIGLYVAVVLAMPILYFLSVGPVVWMFSRIEDSVPEFVETSLSFYFVPAQFVHENSPELVREALEGYVGMFARE